jgi:hypothetical protein
MNHQETEKQAAKDARAVIAGETTWDDFIMAYGETGNQAIATLVDIIEHEPKRGGFLGLNEDHWREYADSRENAIRALEED